ncbi:MAG: acyl-ACP thioesterase domain-containing protein [Spirochaetota bacterium]
MRKIDPISMEFSVHGFDCGWGGPLRVLPMANFLQEAAGISAQELGFGISELVLRGQTWMLVKLDLRVDRLPREGERVRAKTWPSGLDRLLALRDIMLETVDGEPLVRAVYAYLVVDLEARRPLRPERAIPELAEIDIAANGHCVPDFRFGASALDSLDRTAAFSQTACPRHLDNNGHVNNAHILDWLIDAAGMAAGTIPGGSPAAVAKIELSGLRADFLRELLLGEEAAMVHGPGAEGETSTGSIFTITTEVLRGGECVARADSTWRVV